MEKERDKIHKEETRADTRCDEISQFLVNNLGSSVLMSGAMSIGGVFASPIPVIFHAAMFVFGFGTAVCISYSKINHMRWVFDGIKERIYELEIVADELANTLKNAATITRDINDPKPTPSLFIAKRRVAAVIASLQSKGGASRNNHIWHITFTSIVGGLYLILVLYWLLGVQKTGIVSKLLFS